MALGNNATTGLCQNTGAFQGSSSGGPAFFNQIPQERLSALLYQGVLTPNTWILLLDVRTDFIQIQDIWTSNRGTAAADIYFAFPSSQSTWSSTGSLDQDTVFQFGSQVNKMLRETNANIGVAPRQAIWGYATQKTNIRLSGTRASS